MKDRLDKMFMSTRNLHLRFSLKVSCRICVSARFEGHGDSEMLLCVKKGLAKIFYAKGVGALAGYDISSIIAIHKYYKLIQYII